MKREPSALLTAFLASSGACTDTRQLRPGCLFFALKGPNFNGNLFAHQALEAGAGHVVVDDPAVVKDERYILVADVLTALQDVAREHRRTFNIPVLGITGTNGKTTTKELVHAVLSRRFKVLATTGNLNNHIGVPLTLLGLQPDHTLAVIEMGANKPGDIAELTAIAEPTHGILTNVGKAHLEGFGDFNGVLRTKLELYDHLRKAQGTVFVNADDALLMEHSTGIDRVTYGTVPGSALHGQSLRSGPFLALTFGRGKDDHHTAHTRLIGDHNLPNALAAACVGLHFGISASDAADALTSYAPENNRSQFLDTGRNHVVLDAYNANPSSLRAALVNFAGINSDRQKLVIVGDMLELGAVCDTEHRAIVELIGSLGLEALLVGPRFQKNAPGDRPPRVATAQEALELLNGMALRDRLILIKGSRGIKLETVLPAL